MISKVRKRDGRIKDFDSRRIIEAIRKAFKELGYISSYEYINAAGSVVSELSKLDSEICDVEAIQDIVVKVLQESHPEVAKKYEEYRLKRTEIREENSKLIKSVEGLLNFSNDEVMLENSNKQAQLISTTRDLMAGEVSKFIVRKMIPKDILELHDRGIIHLHDMDYGANDMFNCDLVNLQDMLDNGTVINKKMIHSPHTLRTAMTIATQISAQVASYQYGLM